MKKLFLLLLFVGGVINAQIVNIPDPIFKAKLLAADVSNTTASTDGVLNNNTAAPNSYIKIDTNSDGEIQVSEALLIKYINVSGTYNLNGGITDLTGIEAFVNLKFLKCHDNLLTNLNVTNNLDLRWLNCSFNQLTTIDVTLNTNLQNLSCSGNQLTNLDVSHNLNLTALSFSDNLITNLSVINNVGIGYLDCSNNNLTNLDVYQNIHLTSLYCMNNSLISLDVTNNHGLAVLQCDGNLLTNINVSNNLNLAALTCGYNSILNIDVIQNVSLSNLDCSYNQLTSLDLTPNGRLQYLNCQGNQLTNLFIKNGSIENILDFSNNPNLQYICADENQVSSVQAQATPNVLVSSYCSFTPGGTFNTVSGTVRFDMNNNGCNSTDPTLPNSVHLNITDGTVSSGTFPTTDGSYLLYTLTGSNVLSTSLENPAYFTISPSTTTITTTTLGTTQTQDFCITANGVHKDLEVVIVPIQWARPGFEATYKIVYKNKGNQTLSGDVNFTYNDAVLDYVSATVNPNSQSIGNLVWNYANLLPFESRSFTIRLHVNAPTDAPPVNIGDVLNYTATINPIASDETPSDNVFTFHQTVVGSFDPNNKTCLEGDIVSSTKIGDYLHYTINFENTGTAAAQNIVVKDLIDTTKFDINSLQIMNSSHPVTIKISGNKVEFIFQNINLGASQYGNVVFKIKTLSNLTTGTTATNSANIYFDYNFPIQTNIASTTFQTLNNGQFVIDTSIVVFPNPTSSIITVNCNSTIKSIQFYDVQGRLLETKLVDDAKTTINLSEKMTGIYFLKITTANGSKVEKIVKE